MCAFNCKERTTSKKSCMRFNVHRPCLCLFGHLNHMVTWHSCPCTHKQLSSYDGDQTVTQEYVSVYVHVRVDSYISGFKIEFHPKLFFEMLILNIM